VTVPQVVSSRKDARNAKKTETRTHLTLTILASWRETESCVFRNARRGVWGPAPNAGHGRNARAGGVYRSWHCELGAAYGRNERVFEQRIRTNGTNWGSPSSIHSCDSCHSLFLCPYLDRTCIMSSSLWPLRLGGNPNSGRRTRPKRPCGRSLPLMSLRAKRGNLLLEPPAWYSNR
jgi:hypothetical protein